MSCCSEMCSASYTNICGRFVALITYVVITILLSVSILHHPMLEHIDNSKDNPKVDDLHSFNNSVFTNTYITHRTPLAKYRIKKENFNAFKPPMDIDVDKIADKYSEGVDVYTYIQEQVLTRQTEVVNNLNGLVSPIHKAMFLMGCYGDRWNNNTDPYNLKNLLEQDFMNPKAATNSRQFLMNLMLGVLDKNTSVTYVSHDRSTCSCLRDFATPFLLPTQKPKVEGKEQCDVYKHDSCSLKNLTEYNKANGFYSQSIIDEINAYKLNNFVDGTKTFAVIKNDQNHSQTYKDIITFFDFYCQYQNCTKLVFDNPTRTLEQATLDQVLDLMRQWAQNMHPYNTLRAPTLNAQILEEV